MSDIQDYIEFIQKKTLTVTPSIHVYINKINNRLKFHPIWDGGGQNPPTPPTSFSSVTSANVRVSPQNFLTFSFNPFATLVKDHPSKKAFFSGQIVINSRL